MTIHDTAGIRDTTDEVELEGIARARALAALTDVVIYVYISATSEQRFIDSFFATPSPMINNSQIWNTAGSWIYPRDLRVFDLRKSAGNAHENGLQFFLQLQAL